MMIINKAGKTLEVTDLDWDWINKLQHLRHTEEMLTDALKDVKEKYSTEYGYLTRMIDIVGKQRTNALNQVVEREVFTDIKDFRCKWKVIDSVPF